MVYKACKAVTREGKPCPHGATYQGMSLKGQPGWWCHVHANRKRCAPPVSKTLRRRTKRVKARCARERSL